MRFEGRVFMQDGRPCLDGDLDGRQTGGQLVEAVLAKPLEVAAKNGTRVIIVITDVIKPARRVDSSELQPVRPDAEGLRGMCG